VFEDAGQQEGVRLNSGYFRNTVASQNAEQTHTISVQRIKRMSEES